MVPANTDYQRQIRHTLATGAIVVILVAVFGFLSLSRFDAVEGAWEHHNQRTSEIESAMNELDRALGYGGFIHNFKNLVLRRDVKRYHSPLEENKASLLKAMDRLDNLLNLPDEKRALSQIRGTVMTYIEMHDLAESMIEAGKSSAEIDAAVKVSDTQALAARRFLANRVEQRAHQARDEAVATYADARRALLIGGGVLMAALTGFVLAMIVTLKRLMAAHGLIKARTLALETEAEKSRRAGQALLVSSQELARTSGRMRIATEGSGVGVWEIDVATNRLTNNDMMYSLYGITREQYGDDYGIWIARVHADDRERVNSGVLQALAGEQDFNTAFRVVWPKGEQRWIRATAVVQRDASGAALRMVGTNWDITKEKEAEQAKTEFVSTVSHELRTPLTSISGALGLIMGGALGEVATVLKPMLDIAHKNSLRLTHLINDLLDMEKLSAGKFQFDLQVHSLMPLIEQTIESTQAYGNQYNVRFVIDQRADEVQVRVDASRLQQVLANFLSNAAKYSPAGEKVSIKVSQAGNVVRVDVVDRGQGIPEEFRGRIFQKFSQADSSDTRQKGGTGLGLAISKELIERMNGLVGFHSVTDQDSHGTCFHFELPVWRETVPILLAPPTNVPLNAPRLLVVEDEPDIASLLASVLGQAGYRVDVAQTGEAAAKLIAINRYAAMTLDLMLPDRSGVSLVRELRAEPRTQHLPIIMVSAYADDGKLTIGHEFNAIDWIDKPFEPDRLVAAIRRVADHTTSRAPSLSGIATEGTVAGPVAGSESGARPRILHIEDDHDFSKVVAAMAQTVADIHVVGSLAEARHQLARNVYQAVVLDLLLPDGHGLALLPELKAIQPPPAVIVLSGVELNVGQREAVYASLLKTPGSPEHLIKMLRDLIGGGPTVGSSG